jgi:putative spermidine/putrescine transport system ATP-binding protein
VDLQLNGLTKRYGDTAVVDRVSLVVRAGEFVTLLGPSGSGKTTTLMMIAGFVPPTAGDVRLGDSSIVALPPFRRNIGVVFQHYALFPHMTVAQNVAFPLRMRKRARSEVVDRVKGMLALVRLPEMATRRPRELSGGQQQRIALARALVYRPALLLLDEPLSALDRNLRQEMQTEIKRIQRELGVTVVHVTHDQEEALAMSDRVCIMRRGTVVQVGAPQVVYERPATRFVATFIGESNVVRGRDGGMVNGHRVLCADGDVVIRASRDDGAAVAIPLREVAIRPERITLMPEADMDNVLDGRVEEAVYVGEGVKYRVRIAPELALTVKYASPNREAPPLKPGEPVRVGFRAQDVIVLQEEA